MTSNKIDLNYYKNLKSNRHWKALKWEIDVLTPMYMGKTTPLDYRRFLSNETPDQKLVGGRLKFRSIS